MGKLFLFLLYVVFALILGGLSVVLKKKHTQFPDFRVGYHNKKIMENKENWDYANSVAGNLCALFAVIGIIVSVILFLFQANINTTIIIFFIYSIPSVDKSTHGQDRVVSASCCVAFHSAYVQYASFKRLAGH